ncbi:MAG: hypothetical protein KAI83_15460 [Thiomargarita sp.]|nr:hypothetical protein [Thiomargarita sp.]
MDENEGEHAGSPLLKDMMFCRGCVTAIKSCRVGNVFLVQRHHFFNEEGGQ